MKKRRLPLYYKGLLIILGILLILVISILLSKINMLDTDSKEVQELYKFIANDKLDYCEGMPFYADGEINYNNLTNKKKLCLAHRQLNEEVGKSTTLSKTKKKDYCTFAKDKLFSLDESGDVCTVKVIEEKELNNIYKKIFGKDIEKNIDYPLSESLI